MLVLRIMCVYVHVCIKTIWKRESPFCYSGGMELY